MISHPGTGGKDSRLETREFASLAEIQQGDCQDSHSVILDYDVFVNVKRLDAQDVKTVENIYLGARTSDFRLKPGSAAVDRGSDAAERNRRLRWRRAGSWRP